MIIRICVGSSCHLKGSPEIVELLQNAVKENNLEDAYILIKGLLVVEPSRDNYDKYFYLAKELYLLDKEYKDDILEAIEKTKEMGISNGKKIHQRE